jgi:trehalose-phosphatase
LKFSNETQLTEWASQARPLWLFLDYDGTLVDFAPTPDQLEPNEAVINLLGRLSRSPNLCLTVISGRRLRDIQTLLPVPGIFLCGAYGIEFQTPSGESVQRVDYREIRPSLDVVKPQWEAIIAKRKGFFLEDKGWTLALHARFADDTEAQVVLAEAREALDHEFLADRFHILGGHKFLEIAPLSANKKETVLYLLREYPLPGARLLYLGDDDKDEEAFEAIHDHQGVAVKVVQASQSSSATEADYLLKSPQAAVHWLEKLL